MTVQTDLCRTWSETPKTGFLTMRLINILRIKFEDGDDRTPQMKATSTNEMNEIDNMVIYINQVVTDTVDELPIK